eukprot:gene3147-2129_t
MQFNNKLLSTCHNRALPITESKVTNQIPCCASPIGANAITLQTNLQAALNKCTNKTQQTQTSRVTNLSMQPPTQTQPPANNQAAVATTNLQHKLIAIVAGWSSPQPSRNSNTRQHHQKLPMPSNTNTINKTRSHETYTPNKLKHATSCSHKNLLDPPKLTNCKNLQSTNSYKTLPEAVPKTSCTKRKPSSPNPKNLPIQNPQPATPIYKAQLVLITPTPAAIHTANQATQNWLLHGLQTIQRIINTSPNISLVQPTRRHASRPAYLLRGTYNT